MKTLPGREFNGLNIKVMFIEKVEQAEKELSPLMREIRKYMPQAEYDYHVVSGEYPAFYGIRTEFTCNGIRFRVYKINKENKYKIAADMEHFEYVNHCGIKRAGSQYEKPCNINIFTAKKISDWVNYCTQIYRQAEQENAENSKKAADFLKSIENGPINWGRRNYAKGTVARGGLRFTFYVERGRLSFELSLNCRGTIDYDTLQLLADDRYIP